MNRAVQLFAVAMVICLVRCGGDKPSAAPPKPAGSIEASLTDPGCKKKAIRWCLHRHPAPDLDRPKYDSCLQGEYRKCVGAGGPTY